MTEAVILPHVIDLHLNILLNGNNDAKLARLRDQ
jgi:hypothetical protein